MTCPMEHYNLSLVVQAGEARGCLIKHCLAQWGLCFGEGMLTVEIVGDQREREKLEKKCVEQPF